MTRTLRIAGGVLFLTLALALLGTFSPPASLLRHGSGPYASTLSSLGSGTAWAANAPCNYRICEFVAPAWTCLYEGSRTKCDRANGRCTTTCP